ncbi:MAG: HAMP domain-containing protein [Cyanosarcina radialis HA8281-LM2]|jgi:twitching motility protein PilJ|nr:HAMP domain-containing protein [Cyanosarcina radialis HA8281-LM2]
MASGTNYAQEYQQAETAYIQGNYEQAAAIIDRLVEEDPNNPTTRLLRGHIYCYGLHQYQVARAEYESVLQITSDPEVTEYAHNGLEYLRQNPETDRADNYSLEDDLSEPQTADLRRELENLDPSGHLDFDGEEQFDRLTSEVEEIDFPRASDDNDFANPFSDRPQQYYLDDDLADSANNQGGFPLDDEEPERTFLKNTSSADVDSNSEIPDDFLTDDESPFSSPSTRSIDPFTAEEFDGELTPPEEETEFYPNDDRQPTSIHNKQTLVFGTNQIDSTPSEGLSLDDIDPQLDINSFEDTGKIGDTFSQDDPAPSEKTGFLDAFESEKSPEFSGLNTGMTSPSSIGESNAMLAGEPDMFTVTNSSGMRKSSFSDQMTGFTVSNDRPSTSLTAPTWLKSYEKAPLQKKNLYTAIAAGITSAAAVAVVTTLIASTNPANKKDPWKPLGNNAIVSLVAGLATFGTTWFLGRIAARQIKRSTEELQAKIEAGIQGNFSTTATVYSEDEFGRLANRFNQMAGVMMAITSEAQRKAQEEEQKKEDLQRQVIRMLDDVEGAARGDLTVQAEVTADVLGAVADSFNLTIQNLRQIVQQVKVAARQVNQESTASESFARNLSGDALRQAEELAVTLNSVQAITDSIKRVADSAKEAETVARSASETALKGGEAVERTVSGILEIRETVAETTRKVKRLAESSQEISKIIAVVSQIASRTNMLALNASIEAARAGEAGRGFAIVADEVRQLADRSAKALKEIEGIVRQIQSDTGSVMTAMEEGTQQVIEGTKLAEQAKRSLEDIIQVSNRIDVLVRSITADTVEQTEQSQTVAQVMQSVEITAQTTSQEAQRVSGTLQDLVSVAQELLTSVERFRVEEG